MNARIVKRCACGAAYDGRAFAALEAPANASTSEDGAAVLLYRVCSCRSSIARAWCACCGAELVGGASCPVCEPGAFATPGARLHALVALRARAHALADDAGAAGRDLRADVKDES